MTNEYRIRATTEDGKTVDLTIPCLEDHPLTQRGFLEKVAAMAAEEPGIRRAELVEVEDFYTSSGTWGEEDSDEWVCQRCGETVPPAWVTCQETHDGCGGVCQ